MRKILSLIVGMAATLTIANAANIPPGGNVSPAPTLSVGAGATLLASASGSLTQPTFTATYTENVYADPGNEFCSGCLDFTFVFTNSAQSTDGLERFTGGFVNGFQVDAGYVSGSGQAPGSVDRSGAGSPVGWNYTGVNGSSAIMPGSHTATLIYETNATSYGPGNATAQDNYSGSFTPAALGPVTPEPVSMGLLGTGLALVGLARFRRKAAK
jgi:hypothetical protein